MYHRHVGQVGDYTIDPDLLGFSWKDGESFSRPIQSFIIAAITGATSTARPKLLQNFTHVFQGSEFPGRSHPDAVPIMDNFRERLTNVSKEVQRRNALREFPYTRGDP